MKTIKLKHIVLFFGVLLLLSSCFSQKIFLNADKKSGRMVIEYTLDNDYLTILSTALANVPSEDGTTIDPEILIDEEAFKKSFKNTKDITLKSVKIDTKNGYKGNIEVSFTDFEKALATMPKDLLDITVVRNASGLQISQTVDINKIDPSGIFLGFLDQLKLDDVALYNKIVKSAPFTIEINAATPFKEVKGVTLSADKKKVSYTFTLFDLLSSKNKELKFFISL